MKKKRRSLLAVCPAVFLIVLLLHVCGVFSFLEFKSYDDRMKRTASCYTAGDDIALVIIDQESLVWAQKEMGWSWPWPRSAYGDIVRYFTHAGAASVCFDMLYTEDSVYGKDDDEDFARANREFGRTALAVHFLTETDAVFPIEPIRSSAKVLSSVVSTSDSDGVVRRSAYGYSYDGTVYPTLGVSPLVLSGAITDDDLSVLVPADGARAAVNLRYARSMNEYIPYSASQILRSYQALKNGVSPFPDDLIEPEQFAGTDVFFGVYAPGLYDICSTPVSQTYPGVGIHVSMLNTLRGGSGIAMVPFAVVCALLFVSALCGCLVVELAGSSKKHTVSVVLHITGFAAGILLLTAVSYVLFARSIWLPLIALLCAFVASYLISLIVAYYAEGRQKKFIKTAFSQYLSSTVIDQLIADPSRLKLGGDRREITIYFSDVQGFTTISEGLDPAELTSLLNDYLGEMTDIILSSGGTLDKYEGDALIAFWNAPVEEPDHARRGLEAALRCQQRLDELREELQKRSGRPMYQRIGLNTGYAVVGNMGSAKHFNYTMLGDAVNLASRLEGLNKQFGTYTMCSDATRRAALEHGTQLCFRELARAAVVGKKEAVTVYEPMLPEVYERRRKTIESFDAALHLFYDGDFAGAQARFSALAAEDPAAEKYAVKCAELLRSKPEHWNGVWVATSK